MVRDVLLDYSGGARAPSKGRFAVPAAPRPPTDWRDPGEKKVDAGLVGNWWRCSEHGLTQEVVYVGDVVYCPADGCGLQALQVHAAINDPEAVERATSLSARTGSKGNLAQRERAGLLPAKPVITRRLREQEPPRPVTVGDDEDLEVDQDAPEAPELVHDGSEEPRGFDDAVDQVDDAAGELVHDEETESEGSDADASPTETHEETPMPERLPPSVLILELLAKRAPLTRREINEEVLAKRPDLAANISSNVGMALKRLREKREIEQNAEGDWILGLGAAPAELLEKLTKPRAPRPRLRAQTNAEAESGEEPMPLDDSVTVQLTQAQRDRLEAFVRSGPRGMTLDRAVQLFLEAAFAQDAA